MAHELSPYVTILVTLIHNYLQFLNFQNAFALLDRGISHFCLFFGWNLHHAWCEWVGEVEHGILTCEKVKESLSHTQKHGQLVFVSWKGQLDHFLSRMRWQTWPMGDEACRVSGGGMWTFSLIVWHRWNVFRLHWLFTFPFPFSMSFYP